MIYRARLEKAREDGDYNKVFLMDRIIKGRSIGIRMYGMGRELRDSIYTVPA